MQQHHYQLSQHYHPPARQRKQPWHRYLLGNPWFPIGIICLFTFIVGISNTVTGEWLTGWDNLHPEFSFGINIKRSLFAVWQEYQSLGLLGGMGHAAALPREVILGLLSMVFPAIYLRYLWTFSMLAVGGVGVFLFSRDILHDFHPKRNGINQIISLIAGLFYIVFPATQQMFAVPFEAFVTHFGALPILIWTAHRVFHHPTRQHMLWFIATNILLATQAYIPTLFVTYSLLLGLMLITLFLMQTSWSSFKKILMISTITFTLNAYWLLPFIYFTVTRSEITINAKINQMATQEIFLRNKAFGSLHHVITGQSFWIDTRDFMPDEGLNIPVVPYWEKNRNNSVLLLISYMTFGVIVFAFCTILIERKKKHLFLLPLLLLCLVMLVTNTPPFSGIGAVLREMVPIFNQAFRFPFTKWSMATTWIFSLLLAYGLARLLYLQKKWLMYAVIFCSFLGIAWYSIPLLSNQLFYPALRLATPSEYFSLFSYMKTQPHGRIANLPQPIFWGWTYYRWGYTGSGFPWYGIEQPIVDRAFDVWSEVSENYYWELTYALYKKDTSLVDAVLDKYDIRYVLYDDSVTSPTHNRALIPDETKTILSSLSDFKKSQEFGFLHLYERVQDTSDAYVRVTPSLPSIAPDYKWTDYDHGYDTYRSYLSETNNISSGYYYPFRSLFTKRSTSERALKITDHFDNIGIESDPVPSAFFDSVTDMIPFSETSQMIKDKEKNTFILQLNKTNKRYDSGQTDHLNSLNILPCDAINNGIYQATNQSEGNVKWLQFTSEKERSCLSFLVPEVLHNTGYIVAVTSRNISGRPLQFSLINQTAKHTEIDTFLSPSPNWETTYFILPSLAPDGRAYNVLFANDSIGDERTVNDLARIEFYEFPYDQLSSFHISLQESVRTTTDATISQVSHPNTSYYEVTLSNTSHSDVLHLTQAFHPGWFAYTIPCSSSSFTCRIQKGLPFIFGTPLPRHVLVNNWSNGWIIEDLQSPTIVIYFFPQLLQWIGFLLLIEAFIFLLPRRKQ